MNKKCIECKSTKNISEFHKDKTRKDGYCNKCKICDKINIYSRSKKIRNIKMKYPRGVVKTDLYTVGGRFHLNNKPYIGWFHMIDKEFFSGKEPNDGYSKKLTQFQQDFLKPVIEEYKPNIKYFIKKVNEGYVKITDENNYNNYLNNPLYKTIKLDSNNIDEVNKAKQIIPELNQIL